MYDHSVSREFRAAAEGLGARFISGQRFLRSLMDDRPDDFKLSAVTNAHVYHRDAYFVFRVEIREQSIALTPHFRNDIWQGTSDGSASLFDGPIYKLIAVMDGFQKRWAKTNGDEITLHDGTPEDFFARLLGLVRGLHGADSVPVGSCETTSDEVEIVWRETTGLQVGADHGIEFYIGRGMDVSQAPRGLLTLVAFLRGYAWFGDGHGPTVEILVRPNHELGHVRLLTDEKLLIERFVQESVSQGRMEPYGALSRSVFAWTNA